MKKRLWSLLLVMVMLFSVIPARDTSAAVTYNVSKAVDYAKANWNKNSNQLCAEFVSRCVIAGGLKMSVDKGAGTCYRAIKKASGLTEYNVVLNKNGYATKELNGANLAAGDVVVQYCTTCKLYPHILFCNGYNSSGQAVFYAHNAALNNSTYKLGANSLHKNSSCKVVAYAVRLSTLDPAVAGDSVSITDVTAAPIKYASTITFNIKYTGKVPSSAGFFMGRNKDNLNLVISTDVGGTSNPYEFIYTIDNLEHNTTYYYQPYVVQNGKTIKGNVLSFTTPRDTDTITVNSQTECGWNLTIPAGMEWVCYKSATTKDDRIIMQALSSPLTIFCTKYLRMSDNSVRYFFTDASGNSYYIKWYYGISGKMTSTQVHNYKSTVVPGNGNEQEYTLYTCGCGESYKDNYTTGECTHSWGAWQTNSKGEKIRYCSKCGTMQQGTVAVGPGNLAFTDVAQGSYCYDPIVWAVDKGITNGVSSTSFAPNDTCTRGQVVTFLWRAAGSPEPTSSRHPFTDIDSKAFYYKAVLWAVEKGITNGTSATTFGPGESCTRGQVVTFLHRFAGSPAPVTTSHPFVDVSSSSFYYKPMLWAVGEGITNGLTNNTFGPGSNCTRGQIVTFLYRAMN